MLRSGDLVLFHGDSIVAAGRQAQITGVNDPRGLGYGFAQLVAARLLADQPGERYRFLNRGVPGMTLPVLEEQWQEDALEPKPDVISLLVGVNDFAFRMYGRHEETLHDYRIGLHELLDRTRRALPDVRLVLCEPFAFPSNRFREGWLPGFERYREVVQKQAEVFGATFVPFQRALERAKQRAPEQDWSTDGIHPTLAGHQVLADAWSAAVEG